MNTLITVSVVAILNGLFNNIISDGLFWTVFIIALINDGMAVINNINILRRL